MATAPARGAGGSQVSPEFAAARGAAVRRNADGHIPAQHGGAAGLQQHLSDGAVLEERARAVARACAVRHRQESPMRDDYDRVACVHHPRTSHKPHRHMHAHSRHAHRQALGAARTHHNHGPHHECVLRLWFPRHAFRAALNVHGMH